MNNVVDVAFRIQGDRLPVDHAWALSKAVTKILPWINHDIRNGIHQVQIPESGSGWQRPPTGSWMHLSKRTNFMLRVPMDRVEDSRALCGEILSISDCNFTVGKVHIRHLAPLTTLYAHHVIMPLEIDNEDTLLEWTTSLLRKNKIETTQMICGRQRQISTPHNILQTRSLMITELKLEESLMLQTKGLGPYRELGCGLFIPHKSTVATQDIIDN
jgi:CRISPR-associated protein Cas6